VGEAKESLRGAGHATFEELRAAKGQLATRERIEEKALTELQVVLEYADSAALALALVKAEETGELDEDTLDAAWEVRPSTAKPREVSLEGGARVLLCGRNCVSSDS
jgi:hypothetical protein